MKAKVDPNRPDLAVARIIARAELAASLPATLAELTKVMQELYGDAYLAGTHAAATQAAAQGAGGVTVVSSLGDLSSQIDWNNWQPGWGDAADKAASGGLQDLLASAGSTVRGMTSSMLTRIGDTLAAAMDEGLGARETAGLLDDLVTDPARAYMIAVTETARAMTAATFDTYRENGIGSWDLLTSPGACPTCLAVADSNPHPLGEQGPPYHPHCRCSAAPSQEAIAAVLDNV